MAEVGTRMYLGNHLVGTYVDGVEVFTNTFEYEEAPGSYVTDGLILAWDIGNPSSYPGTGTTIYDLSGNDYSGSLIGGVTYSSDYGGVLEFDGTGVVRTATSLTPDLRYVSHSVMGASRYNGATRGRMINAYDDNWLMGNWSNSTENYYAEGWVTSVGNGANDTNWRIYAALGDRPNDQWSLYVNDVLEASSAAGAFGPAGFSVGAAQGNAASEPSTGQFSFLLVYDRTLTTDEMTQNYDYFKARFGL